MLGIQAQLITVAIVTCLAIVGCYTPRNDALLHQSAPLEAGKSALVTISLVDSERSDSSVAGTTARYNFWLHDRDLAMVAEVSESSPGMISVTVDGDQVGHTRQKVGDNVYLESDNLGEGLGLHMAASMLLSVLQWEENGSSATRASTQPAPDVVGILMLESSDGDGLAFTGSVTTHGRKQSFRGMLAVKPAAGGGEDILE